MADATRTLDTSARVRARRWDVAFLGSGIAALVAASRVAAAGSSALVIEEAEARDAFAGLRDPFSLGGPGGLLDATLRELQLPLIDRRRVVPREVAHQLIGDELRMDVGPPALTAAEWISWGAAKPDAATRIVTALAQGAEAEAFEAALHEAPRLRELLEIQGRALSNTPDPPGIAAQRQLLQSPLRGGFGFDDPPPWLSGILRRRAESLGVDFRAVRGAFELVESDGQAGVWIEERGELWLSRTLVIAAADAAVIAALPKGSEAGVLDPQRAARRRHAFVYQAPHENIPEPMAESLILLPETAEDDGEPATVSLYRGAGKSRSAVLVVRQLLAASETREAAEFRLRARLAALMPGAGEALVALPAGLPSWDDDDWLVEDRPGSEEPLTRLSARPLTMRLERSHFAARGLDGDLSLGWLAGEALAQSRR